MLKVEEPNHATRVHAKSRNVENLIELRLWVAHVIDDAEKNGDVRKKAKFLALQAELV